jgi:nitrous oxidase accessory protein NosD
MRMRWLLVSILFGGIVALAACGDETPTGLAGAALEAASPHPKTIRVPGGSVDALDAAIAAAGPGGEVVLEAGLHTESSGVVIPHTLTLRGQGLAVLRVNTHPALQFDPALHVLGADRTEIRNLEIRPQDPIGGVAVLLENSPRAAVIGTKIYDHYISVLVEKSDHTEIAFNIIEASPAWQTGGLPEAHGIVVMNGKFANVHGNQISRALFGAWLCDGKGSASENVMFDNLIGLILCKVPEGYVLPSGEVTGSVLPATAWQVHNNVSKNNLDIGYLVIDGANRNHLSNNGAFGNGTYDIELTGDTYRFGFLTPASRNNVVTVGNYKSLRAKDCGIGNKLITPDPVDTIVEPCN